ncbi:MAG: hypothetical protein Q8M29_11780 [Bacteroidota bacterium]|nr:hypothetical protein [Bacteroidota bacterium]
MRSFLYCIIIIALFSSCAGKSFLSQKYTHLHLNSKKEKKHGLSSEDKSEKEKITITALSKINISSFRENQIEKEESFIKKQPVKLTKSKDLAASTVLFSDRQLISKKNDKKTIASKNGKKELRKILFVFIGLLVLISIILLIGIIFLFANPLVGIIILATLLLAALGIWLYSVYG